MNCPYCGTKNLTYGKIKPNGEQPVTCNRCQVIFWIHHQMEEEDGTDQD